MKPRMYTVCGARARAYEQGEGPTVLMIHGTGGSGKVWFNQLRRLGTSHRVVSIDLPGYGESELPGSVRSVDDYADFVADWIRAAGWASAVVVGNSMGGRVALQLSLDHPELVRGLVLVDASGIRVPGVETLSPADMSPDDFLKALFYRPAPFAPQGEGRPRWHATMEQLTRTPLRDMASQLAQVRVPTLVVWGRHDRVIPGEYAEAFARGIPGARLAWIEHAGHVPMLERPGEVNEAIAAFLADMEETR